MYDFVYQRPHSLSEAEAALTAGAEPKLLAGGMTLIPTLKQRLAQPSHLISLAAIPGLAGIRLEGGRLTIGAMTRHAAVAASAEVRRAVPALAALAEGIGDPQVRNRGTIAGSVANNDPAADYPAAVLGLGAVVRTTRRDIAADAFFTGMFETALEASEIITAIEFPVPEAAGYAKAPNPASRYATVGVMVSRIAGAVRVAVTGAGPCVFRVPEMEQALARRFAPEALAGIRISPEGLNSDIHADAEYRAHLVGVMAARAVVLAAGR